MAFVWFNQGEGVSARATLNIAAAQNLEIGLYKTDVTPAANHTEANYTESDFPGYARVALVAGTWVVTEGAPTTAEYVEQVFTRNAAGANQPQYGYFLRQAVSGKYLGAEKFADGPYQMMNLNDKTFVGLVLSFAGSLG